MCSTPARSARLRRRPKWSVDSQARGPIPRAGALGDFPQPAAPLRRRWRLDPLRASPSGGGRLAPHPAAELDPSRSPRSGPPVVRSPQPTVADAASPAARAAPPRRAQPHDIPVVATNSPVSQSAYDPSNPPPPPQFPPQTPSSRSRPASEQAGSSYALPAPEPTGSDPPPNNVHIGEDTAEGGRTASFHACSGAAPRRGSTGRSNQGNGDPGSAPRAEPTAALHRRRDSFRHYCRYRSTWLAPSFVRLVLRKRSQARWPTHTESPGPFLRTPN